MDVDQVVEMLLTIVTISDKDAEFKVVDSMVFREKIFCGGIYE